MEFIERVSASNAVGARDARPGRDTIAPGKSEDYESFFKSFADNILKKHGSILLDGKVLLEFVPKSYMINDRLISPETSFFFHEYAEKSGYKTEARQKNKNPALESYNYQKSLKPLDVSFLEGFMPVI